jgi:hypothetical protein
MVLFGLFTQHGGAGTLSAATTFDISIRLLAFSQN